MDNSQILRKVKGQERICLGKTIVMWEEIGRELLRRSRLRERDFRIRGRLGKLKRMNFIRDRQWE